MWFLSKKNSGIFTQKNVISSVKIPKPGGPGGKLSWPYMNTKIGVGSHLDANNRMQFVP